MTARPVTDIVWPRYVNEVPKEVFVREDVFELEQERIFRGPEWHGIAHCAEVPNPGDFKTFSIGAVPLLVVHGSDGQIRTFFNACSHRANQIETRAMGNRQRFQCPYHRWMFNLEGELTGCPNSDEYAPGFKKQDYPLAQPRTEIFHGFVFVTLHPDTPSLEDWLGPVAATLKEALGGGEELRLLGYQKVSYRANWKTVADNDGWHAGLLHKAFQMLKWQGGQGRQFTDDTRGHLGYEGEVKPLGETDLIKDSSLIRFRETDPYKGASRLVGLYPMSGIAKHLDTINIRFANALSVDETEIHFAYFAKASDDEQYVLDRVRQSSNLLGPCGMVSMEDASVFHRLHIGSNTPGNAVFQKGVQSLNSLDYELKQNDEAGGLLRWEYYRSQMGFDRAVA